MANEWNKTAFVEFEAMLRRRLRRGAAPVVACAGFDLDAASAYLEGALGGSQRTRYESHLAGCAACRRHLIELSRLAQTVPRAGMQVATVMDRTPAWVRCREIVAGWFDLSTWNLKWQMVGVAGAAFAILIAALSAQLGRQAPNQADIVITPSATPSTAADELAPQSSQPLTVEPSPQDVAVPVAGNLVATHREQSPVPLPTPFVGPRGDVLDLVVTASPETLTLSANQSSEAPGAAKSVSAEARQNPPPQPGGFVETDSSAQGARITPPHGYNPMNPGQPKPDLSPRTLALGEEGRMTQVNRQSPEPPPRIKEPLKLPGFVKTWLPRIKSKSKSESERKESAEASEDKSPKPMQVVIRDKIFCFEKCKGPDLEKIRGMWIDREYDFEKQKWNVWTLKNGGKEYKQALADEPQLKEFFDHRPILIVWKDRIYKVLK